MSEKKKETQKTPKGKEIPVPTREDIFEDLKNATKPDRKSGSSRRSKKEKAKEWFWVVSVVVPPRVLIEIAL